jgi:hypothetical protein
VTLVWMWKLHHRADQSYWQSAIAATPAAAWKGYLLGAMLWFCVPFTLSTGTPMSAWRYGMRCRWPLCPLG